MLVQKYLNIMYAINVLSLQLYSSFQYIRGIPKVISRYLARFSNTQENPHHL